MRYASAPAAERRRAALAKIREKTMRNRRDKCINTLEPEHLNRRVLIGKRPSQRVLTSKVDRLLQKILVRLGPMPKRNHQRCTHQASKPHFCQRIEESPRRPSTILMRPSVQSVPDSAATASQDR